MDKYDKIVRDYNNNEIDDVIRGIFNDDVQLFYKYLDKRGKFEDLDFDTTDTDHYYNQHLLYLANNKPEKFLDFANNLLVDIKKGEDGEFYVVTSDYSDIADLFCERRNSLSPKSIEAILQGDDDIRYFDYMTDEIYRDVIEDLDEENLQILYRAIIRDKTPIRIDTELLEEIAEEQKQEDYVELTLDNLPIIFKDEESAMSVLNQLQENDSEIKNDLQLIHEGAYNDAYHSEVYENVMDELEKYFSNKPEYVPPTEANKNGYVRIKLNKSEFFNYLKDFVQSNVNFPNDNFEYYGYYLRMVKEDDCLTAFAPDYPDWSKIKENINSNFSSYF